MPPAASRHDASSEVDLGTLEQAFHQACAIADAPSRDAWLQQLHARQPAVAQALQPLLACRHEAAPFFDRIAAQARALAAKAWQPGESVGPYRIVETLGAGGMGVVYRAHDERLARDVALKFLHPARADDTALKVRFLEEARAASRLDHHNICAVHEIAETASGQTYIVMALCPGVDLATRLAQAALSLDEILRIGLQLTDALAAAHGAGVLHRDLKPANLIVDEACRLRLVDFGIATILQAQQTTDDGPVGTLSYMAPEQLRGDTLDARCDIWAVGVTLYESLTGRRPFRDGATRVQARSALQATPPAPGSVAPGVPEALDGIVMRCLAQAPAERFASAAELREALRQVQQALRGDARADLAPALASTSGRLQWADLAADATPPDDHRAHQVTVLLQRSADEPGPSWADAIARFGGRVVEDTASGQAAVFGYPLADEFAAQRAVRAALALPAHHTLALASGPAWSAPTGRGTALGGPAFDAARTLLHTTEDGACALADGTHARVRHLVVSTPRASVDGAPPTAYLLRRTAPVAHRFAQWSALTPFVGRVHEAGLLREAWERSLDGNSETVLVAGEPGIGKSRLVHEFKAAVDAAGQGWSAVCYCAPHQSAWSLHPIATGLLQAWLPPGPISRGAFDRWLAEHGIDEAAPRQALRRLFNQPAPDAGADEVPLSPEALKEHTLAGLTRLVRARAARQPGLLIVEDLHWADPTTLQWLGHLRRDAQGSALLLVGTHRPGFRPTWGDAHDITRIALARLRRAQAEMLLSATLGGRPLDEARRTQALERSEGNPLFIEELAAAMVDASAAADGSEVPWSLRDALLARLDRLGEAKDVAQTAAVIGREFDRALLRAVQQAVHGMDPARTDRALQSLESAGLAQQRGASGEALWFKHALVRDAAYESLEPAARSARHRSVAEVLLTQFPDRAEREPAGVAHHLQLGGELARAAEHHLKAARQALERFAIEEAQTHVQHGLQALATLPPSPTTLHTELNLQVTLGPALMAARGYANEGVAAAYARARELCGALGHPPEVLPALFGSWTYLCVSAQHPAAAALAQDMVDLARATPDAAERNEYLTESLMVRGVSHYYRGELQAAAQDFDDAFSHYDPRTALRHILRYGQDATMIIRCYQVWNCALLGRPDLSDGYAREALASARAMRHPFSIACGLNFAAWHALNRGRMAEAEQMLAENIALCREQRLQVFLGLAMALDAVRRVAVGDVAGGSAALGEALALYNATGAQLFGPAWSGVIAQGMLAAGQLAAAAASLDEAFATLARTDERWCEADLWRVRALHRGLSGDAEGAARALATARDTVRRQGSVGWLPAIDAAAAQLGLPPG